MQRFVLPSILLAVAAPLAAQTIVIGETEIPGGLPAFAHIATCLDLEDGCGAQIGYLGPPPLYPFYGMTSGLTAVHILDVVPTDFDIDDEIHLEFAPSIVNQDGADLYLAQAEFLGELGTFDTLGVVDMDLRLGTDPTWHPLLRSAFVRDHQLSPPTVWYIDSEIKSDAYYLWYVAIDLTDFGIAPGESLETLDLRGPVVPAWPETLGLDIVTVASLNVPAAPQLEITSPADGDRVSGLVVIEASVVGLDPAGVRFQVDGQTVCSVRTEPWDCEWDSSGSTNGVVRLRASAVGPTGVRAGDQIRVRVDN